MIYRAQHTALSLTAFLLLAGCSTAPQLPPFAGAASHSCLDLFAAADQAVAEARVADAGAAKIPGFPWLRVDRFLASLRGEVQEPEVFREWLAHLADLDRKARLAELANLDHARNRALQDHWLAIAEPHHLPTDLAEALDHCRIRLNDAVAHSETTRDALIAAGQAPDSYNTWQRILGVYPLTAGIARPRVMALHRRLQEIYREDPGQRGPFHHYSTNLGLPPTREHGARLVQVLPRDSLGIPAVDPGTRDQLLAAHAPIWSVETHSSADLPGTLRLDDKAEPWVDTARGTEYRWLSLTRFGGEVLVQLNYLVWFAERPGTTAFDLATGELDGVIWRTTLDSAGQVLAHDSIHACGCYYTLFAGAGWRLTLQPRNQEPVFAPARAPEPQTGERLVLRLAAGSRYFIDVAPMALSPGTVSLRPAPADDLRSLPLTSGGRASVYGHNGLIPASRRPERFVLWPLGVPSPGAMRQPGTHAIAFLGRRHFDDAWLLEGLLTRGTQQ